MKPRQLCNGQRSPVVDPPESTPEAHFPKIEVRDEPKIAIEKHYTPAQIAGALNISDTKARRLFQNKPGVLKIGEPSRRLGRKLKRRYYILRIPGGVAMFTSVCPATLHTTPSESLRACLLSTSEHRPQTSAAR
jgi:hypothetical protein